MCQEVRSENPDLRRGWCSEELAAREAKVKTSQPKASLSFKALSAALPNAAEDVEAPTEAPDRVNHHKRGQPIFGARSRSDVARRENATMLGGRSCCGRQSDRTNWMSRPPKG